MVDPKKLIDTSKVVVGRIISASSGVVKLNEPVGKSDEFRASEFTKFEEGTLVECTFRVSADGGRKLLFVKPVEAVKKKEDTSMASWSVVITTIDANRIQAIKELREITGLELKDCKQLSEELANKSTEQEVKSGFGSKAEAEKFIEEMNGKYRTLTFEVRQTKAAQPAPVVDPTPKRPEDEIDIPEYVSGHYLSTELRLSFSLAGRLLSTGDHVKMLMRGPSGYGKTSLGQAIGKFWGVPVEIVDCAAVMDNESWFGFPEIRDGETRFVPTDLTRRIEEGNCVIILDEGNRIQAWIKNILFPLLDHRRRTKVHNYEIVAGPGILWLETINEGVKFAGTHVMDAAYLNRFDFIHRVEAMPKSEEANMLVNIFGIDPSYAKKIVAVCSKLRQVVIDEMIDVDVSTRTALNVAKKVSVGASLKTAFNFSVVNATSEKERKPIVDAINLALNER